MPEGTKNLKLRDVWRTCNKIRAAIFRVGLNLWDYYKPLDPNNNSLLSESKFVSVLTGPLRGPIGLSDQEIGDLADYFRVQDGRILYTQFCQVIHDSVPEFGKNKSLVTGLEWEDPLHVNRLSHTEHRRLSLIITQIAVLINKRKLILRPYFQDYELVSKNSGTVTFAHFARVLNFLGIVLAADEFNLLVKRFVKDSYTVNYVAFVKAVEDAQNYMDQHGMLDLGGNLLDQFPGRIITAELPKLPRPEIGRVLPSEVFERQSVFHPVMEKRKELMPLREVLQRVQRHVLEHRIRVNEFFRDFDPLNCGRVTVSQFRRALDGMQISAVARLYLAEPEIESIIAFYTDCNDPERINWRTFEDDLDQVFTVKELDKLPTLRIDPPPTEIAELCKRGQKDWQREKPSSRELCEAALHRVRRRIEERGILLKQFFKAYDAHNHGHVTRSQLRQTMTTACILLSREEVYALEQRYNDELGFNYAWFIEEMEALPKEVPLYYAMLEEKKLINAEKSPPNPTSDESNIVLILAKIKAKIVRERIGVLEFLTPFDPRRELIIGRADFIRGLDQLRCNLSCREIETIFEVFKAPLRPQFIEYARFAEAVEEALATGSLERAPLLVPVQHLPSTACTRTFLNFEERRVLAQAMDKLCTQKNMNMEELFADFDKENIGSVSLDCLTKALSTRNMLHIVSSVELETVYKCFGIERGGRLEFDYRAFLRALYLLQENKRTNPI
ncbi:uncharacterized protein LOC124299634 [Neodiprion virginianus]|uniref:uncharacterized protein LOC124299634 n=1 Tax=Neodiprion virginianus TaxID=2961670 RepID=UPI001EE6FF9F|nr:uncharacterized protein LOC124299634 [Neodiprion virginianus]